MPTILSSIAKQLQRVYRKAEDFIEEEREFPLSQVFLNATFKRYVTDNVEILEDLHADLYNDWLRLYATLNVKGLHTTLSVDLKLIQMELNKELQLIVFEQISDTQIVTATYKNIFQKFAVKSALFFYQKVLKKDPLGVILEKFDVVKVRDDLLYLDLNRWLGKKRKIIETLAKVHVNHAVLRDAELVIMGNVNLMALFSKSEDEYDEIDEELDIAETEITPIKQKED